MTPVLSDQWLTVYGGDVRDVLPTLPAESVHCVVTSPPYWGLRDYGTALWEGGDAGCDHSDAMHTSDPVPPQFRQCERCGRMSRTRWLSATEVLAECGGCGLATRQTEASGGSGRWVLESHSGMNDKARRVTNLCRSCGAIRQDRQLGLEPTPEEYVANMVAVFREVRRVLRADGTVWLNLGDSYNGVGRGEKANGLQIAARATTQRTVRGLKSKDLVGIPWRVAFALQADGWYLRSDVIWSKPNPMPESVTDRPTKSHEYLFLLSKSPRYYYDADAVREPAAYPDGMNGKGPVKSPHGQGFAAGRSNGSTAAGRNLRSVWTIATAPYPGAHFATFPPKLVEPCVKASTSERGVCPECGAPWVRVVETRRRYVVSEGGSHADGTYRVKYSEEPHDVGFREREDGFSINKTRWHNFPETAGWRLECGHHDAECDNDPLGGHPNAIPATVLDIFAGSGTVGMVAQSLSRRAVLIDLNPDYLRQCLARNAAMPLGLGT